MTTINLSQEQLCAFRDVLIAILGAIEKPKGEPKEITHSPQTNGKTYKKSWKLFKSMSEKGFMTYEDASNYSGISITALSNLCTKEKIPHTRIGRFRFFTQKDLDTYLSHCFKKPS